MVGFDLGTAKLVEQTRRPAVRRPRRHPSAYRVWPGLPGLCAA